MDEYIDFTDEQLQAMSQNGDSRAESMLAGRYNKLVKRCARSYFLAGGDGEDLIQEGMMGLLTAIRTYNPGKGATFRTYLEICVNSRLLTAIKSATRDKHAPLNNYVSLESLICNDLHAKASIFLRDLEEQVLAKESAYELSNDFIRYLSKFEAGILKLYLGGNSYQEIALRVNKSTKSVDNAVQRIRKKLTQYLDSGEISSS